MSQIIITEPYSRKPDTEVISIERANTLRAMRRRRVAKRMYTGFFVYRKKIENKFVKLVLVSTNKPIFATPNKSRK